LTERDREREG
jgi:hypothetical protein